MSEMFIMPPRLFSAPLKQIITTKQKKQDASLVKQSLNEKQSSALLGGLGGGGFTPGEDSRMSAAAGALSKSNKKGLK